MAEERNYMNPAPTAHYQTRPSENQVKVNFTFEVALTDTLRDNIGKGIYSPSKVSARLNKLVGAGLASIALKDNSFFEGKFIVTDINDRIMGVYLSQSMIRLTTELQLLQVLRDELKELADTPHVNAEINLNCYF